ncbi:Permease [Candidatus Sulfopaludibacter sp. SbA4]|nr:Permease [Candidatus Sulfopaludibacter sp. SbA4]
MAALLRDFRHGVRMLLKKPGFTLAAVAVLSLGIGANTAIFSLVNAFLLKPLPIHKPEELVGCYSKDTRKPDYRAFSYPNYVDLRENNNVFTSLAAHNMAMVGLAEGDSTRRLFADIVSSNYFNTVGVSPFRGRPFTAAEERPGSGIPSAIVSYSYWKKTGADPELLGKTLRVNGRIFNIVGVLPEGFTGTIALMSPELYFPLGMYEQVMNDFEGHVRPLAARKNEAIILVGRLRPGLTPETADPLLAAAASRLEQAYPGENKNQTFVARRLSRLSFGTGPQSDGPLIASSVLLLAMAGVVLLIASLNVANMMLARGAARSKEIAIRLAIGGSRLDILRQLFTEGLVLALLGGAAGLAVAFWSTSAMVRSMAMLAPIDLVYSAGPDVRVLFATMAFCLLSTLLFGLGPALRLSRPSLLPALKDGPAEDLAGGKPRRLFARRNVLVMSQIALSLMLLTAAGLFVRSSLAVAHVEPGFRLDHEVRVEVDPSLAGHDEARGRQIYRALLGRLRSMPGVESASVAATVPFGMISLGRAIQRSSDTPKISSRSNIVGADYFQTLGIPLVRGRSFSAAETEDPKTPRVVILDHLAAERLWPKGDAVGQHIRLLPEDGTSPAEDAEVVGVAGNVRENIWGGDLQPHVYVPFGQQYQANMNIHLRIAAAGPEAEARLLGAVRQEIRNVDAALPVLTLKTMRGSLESSFDWWLVATGARMFLIFGGVALLLATIGLYGVRSYTVAMRTREIGIRMALGADARDSLRMMLREGILLTTVGVSTGLVLSLALGRLLASMLYHVSAADPLVLSTAPVLLAAVSLLACYFPARKAARVDPMTALRHE